MLRLGLEVRRVLSALIRPVWIPFGTFDLDDVRAEIREHHPGARTGDERALLHDANAGEGRLHGSRAARPRHSA